MGMKDMDKKYISDNKRVILITGDQSKWYEQAIFIVKKNAMNNYNALDIIAEAEMIMRNYVLENNAAEKDENLTQSNKKPPVKGKNKSQSQHRTAFKKIINIALTITVAGIFALLTRNLF